MEDEEWLPEAEEVNDVSVQPRQSRRRKKDVDYISEKKDNYFDNYPGLTNFGRTRKGGDRRPRASPKCVRVVNNECLLVCCLCTFQRLTHLLLPTEKDCFHFNTTTNDVKFPA